MMFPRSERNGTRSFWDAFFDYCEGGWTSYLATGITALFVSWILSGCRFGNHVDDKSNGAVSDTVTGYYQTQPIALSFSTTALGSTQEKRTTVASDSIANLVPDVFAQVFTDPTAVQYKSDAAAIFIFNGLAPHPASVYGVPFDPKTMSFSGTMENQFQLSSSSNCIWDSSQYFSDGQLDHNGIGQLVGGLPTAGHMKVNVQKLDLFKGQCPADLMNAVMNCYLDWSACGQSTDDLNRQLQGLFKGIYDPFVKAGVMTYKDIPNLWSLHVELEYQ